MFARVGDWVRRVPALGWVVVMLAASLVWERRARVDAVDSLEWQASELGSQIEDLESLIADLQSEIDGLKRNRTWP